MFEEKMLNIEKQKQVAPQKELLDHIKISSQLTD